MFDRSNFRLDSTKIENMINSANIKSLQETTREQIAANRQRRAERVQQSKERKKERNELKARAEAETQALINQGTDPDEARAKALDALKADKEFMTKALNAGMRVGESPYAGSLTYQVKNAQERAERKARTDKAKDHLFDAQGKPKLYDPKSGQMVSASDAANYARIKAENEKRTQERFQAAQPQKPKTGRTVDYINPNSPEARVIADIKAGTLDPVVLRTSEPSHQRAIRAVEAGGITVPKEITRQEIERRGEEAAQNVAAKQKQRDVETSARVRAAELATHAEINARRMAEIAARQRKIEREESYPKAADVAAKKAANAAARKRQFDELMGRRNTSTSNQKPIKPRPIPPNLVPYTGSNQPRTGIDTSRIPRGNSL